MDHVEALNLILANACPRDACKEYVVFEFDLHCATARVEAKLVSTVGSIQYKIGSVTINA